MRLRSSFGRNTLLLLALTSFAAVGCSEGATEPATGSLAVLVDGLPAGVSAGVTVTGPNGFSQTVNASDTLEKVAPGAYTVTSSGVTTAQGAKFAVAVTSQQVTVAKGTVAAASVGFTTTTGGLRIQVTGLPAGTRPWVEVRNAIFFTSVFSADTTIYGLAPGSYTVTVNPVMSGDTRLAGTPRQMTVSIPAALAPVTVPLAYAEARLNLTIAAAYITQSVQRLDGTVPLVQGREGLIRVFPVADEANGLRPAVRVRLFQGSSVVFDATSMADQSSVPLVPNADIASSSVNFAVDGSLIQPGVSMVVELDPASSISEGDEADNRYPAAGAKALDVRVMPTLRVLLVQLHDSAGNLLGNLGNTDTLLSQTHKMFPVGAMNVVVRSQPFVIPKPLLAPITAVNEGWAPALEAMAAAREAEANPELATRMWYGVAKVTYSSGVAGLGYLGYPASIGWDYPGSSTVSSGSASSVMAHELGHNFNRKHAPCGNVGGADPNYPTSAGYGNGAIGHAGYDISTNQVVSSGRADLMGYCNGIWISDYTYEGTLSFRSGTGLFAQPSTGAGFASASVQPALLIWGSVAQSGEVRLNPSFEIVTRPSIKAAGGGYVVRGLAADGRVLFSHSFEPSSIADAPEAGRYFAFSVPMSAESRSQLVSVEVVGRNGRRARASSRAASVLANAGVRAERAAGGRARVRWNAGSGSMAMIRDPATGHVLAFARGGNFPVKTTATELEVVVSDGVRSRSSRVRVAQ